MKILTEKNFVNQCFSSYIVSAGVTSEIIQKIEGDDNDNKMNNHIEKSIKHNKIIDLFFLTFISSINGELNLILHFDLLMENLKYSSITEELLKLLDRLLNKLKNFNYSVKTSFYLLYKFKNKEFVNIKNYFYRLNDIIDNNKEYEEKVKEKLKKIIEFYLNILNSF